MLGEAVSKQRLWFFDNLRAFIVLLVVVFHVGMGYTTWDLSWWYVNDSQQNKVFDWFILSTDVYMMPVLFFIAGYFALPALLQKGMAAFWRGKLRRIVLPWLVGAVLIAPLIAYSAIFSRTAAPPDYFAFWAHDFWGPYWQQAHYWFLEVLALFYLFFAVVYKLSPSYFKAGPDPGLPAAWFLPLFAVFSGMPFFVANLFFWSDLWLPIKPVLMIQPVRIGLYACYFGLGIYAWKKAWFTAGGYRPRLLTWGSAAVAMLVVFTAYRVTYTLTPNIPVLYKAGHALAYAFFSLTATFGFIALFQKFADSDAYLWRRLAANSYTIYFIHQCVVIPVAYTVQKVQMNIWVKYAGVSAVVVVLCFLIAEYVIRPVLSGRRGGGAEGIFRG